MTVTDFDKNYRLFENMAIWEIQDLNHFFEGEEPMLNIFKDEYGFEYSELESHKDTFTDTPFMVVSRVLDYFGDKHFFVFENNNKHLNPNRIYVLMMDKSKNPALYDTV